MLGLITVNWRNDRATQEFIDAHREMLQSPETMKPGDLGTAVTYCKTIHNPYAMEIMRRSGHLDRFKEAWLEKERYQIFDKACRYHGMIIM